MKIIIDLEQGQTPRLLRKRAKIAHKLANERAHRSEHKADHLEEQAEELEEKGDWRSLRLAWHKRRKAAELREFA